MNTWNSESLFTAFAMSEGDDETIVETVEDGVTVIRAESEDMDEIDASDIETIEFGNVAIVVPGVAREVPGLRRSWQVINKTGVLHLNVTEHWRRPGLCAATALWETHQRMPVARAMAQGSAGTPLFLAA